MVDTARTLSDLQALFADNNLGNIGSQDLRDFLVTALFTTNNLAIVNTDTTASIFNHYAIDISGMTIDNNFILPAANVGDEVTLFIKGDSDDYELIVKGDVGITINSGTANTEWSRLFISGESIKLKATSTSNWDVVYDGRIPQSTKIYKNVAQTLLPSTDTVITCDLLEYKRGAKEDLVSNTIQMRRDGTYIVDVSATIKINDSYSLLVGVGVNAEVGPSNNPQFSIQSARLNASTSISNSFTKPFNTDDTVRLYVYQSDIASKDTRFGTTSLQPSISVLEIL